MTTTLRQSPPESEVDKPAKTLDVRPSRWTRHRELWLGLIGLLTVMVAWQLCAWFGVIDVSFTSSPLGAVAALGDSFASGEVWPPVGSTLASVGIGMVITLVVGIPAGLVIGRSPILYGLTVQMISIMYAVPFVVFLPIIIFWFGIGDEARIVIVVWSALFPLLINVVAGGRNLDSNYLRVSQAFCASRFRTLWSVALPATLPYILAGVRQAVGRALVGAIVAELFMGTDGLGYLVQLKTANFQMDAAMAAIVVIAIVAVVLTRGVAYLERKLTFWSVND
jgi:ABC-type nitrate/sulfonate/bicarbonate transport system permease component